MNRWINWLFNSKPLAPIPAASEGDVRMEGSKVIYCAKNGFRETVVDLTKLQYVYVYTTEDRQNLVLNDHHQHFIPCSAHGFELFFRNLSETLSLDPTRFFETLANKKPQKVELWRTLAPNNCEILHSGELAGLAKEMSEGFIVNTDPSQRIYWDMTSETLASLPFVYQTLNEYKLAELRFHFPVRLGNLLLSDWRYYLPGRHRLDVPLDSFYSNLHIQGNGDQNYYLAKKALTALLGESNEGYERADQNACYWHFHGLKFSLLYWYDGQHSYESGHAYLSIENKREYRDYITDQDYELNGKISKCLLLNESFLISSDFRRSRYFKKTPEFAASKLTAEAMNFIVWLDEANTRVGFANHSYAMIFPVEAVAGFQLENVYPGRTKGGTYFSVSLTDGSQQSIMTGDCNALDPYMDKIAEVIQLPWVEHPPSEA